MKKLILSIVINLLLWTGLANADQFFFWRERHAADCTALTDGKYYDLCRNTGSPYLLYQCKNSGGCTGSSDWALSGSRPAGNSGEIQTNSSGVMGAVTGSSNDSNGNVGIGTATPQTKLHVVGTITGTSFVASGSSAITFTPNNGVIQNTNAGYIDVTGGLLTTGNIGAGTTLPARKLEVVGSDSGTTLTTASGASMGIVNQNTTNNNFVDYAMSTVDSSGSQVLGAKMSGVFTSHTAGAVSADTLFLNKNSGTTAEKMRLTSAGNLGIGTATPQSVLDVNGTSSFRGMVKYRNAAGTELSRWYTDDSTNLFLGYLAGNANTVTGSSLGGQINTFIGSSAGALNTSGKFNSAFGYTALRANLTGVNNVAFGGQALANSTASENTAVGLSSMYNNTTGSFNTAVGEYSLDLNQTGADNVAVGLQALYATTGSDNTGLGYGAGSSMTSGSNNIIIGSGAQVASNTSSNQLSIGNWIYGTSGNIGVGTNAPGSNLSVLGSESIGSYATKAAPTGGLITSGNVGIGTSVPATGPDAGNSGGTGVPGSGARLTLVGIGTTLAGATLNIRNSSGTLKSTFLDDGSIGIAKGTNATVYIDPNDNVKIRPVFNDSNQDTSINAATEQDGAGNLIGVFGTAYHFATVTPNGTAYGVYGQTADTSATQAPTGNYYGVYGTNYLGANLARTNSSYGVFAAAGTVASGSATNNYALGASGWSVFTGNVGIGTTSTDAYTTQIPTNGGLIVFGNVGIGTWTAGTKVDVVGTVRATAFQVSGNVGIGTTGATCSCTRYQGGICTVGSCT